jgi:1,3-propanediol dehydrogenase
MTILSRSIMPDISLIDPRLLQTKPEDLMAATGMDTLTHAIEAYVSSLSWPLTDPHAIHAIELVWLHLLNAVRNKNVDSLVGMSIACLEAGVAFSNAILGAVHALAHPIGGLYDLHHGLINSVLLPVVVGQNMEHAKGKFANIARAMGVETRGMTRDDAAGHVRYQIENLVHNLGMPTRFSQLGLNTEDIPLLAKLAQQDLCMLTNPCCFSLDEIEAMYREVW